MEDVLEALFISTLNNERASCLVQDLRTGTDLMKYKGGGSLQPHGFRLLGSNFVIGCNSTKPLLHVWPINGQEQMSNVRYVVPGKVNAMAMTPDCAFLVAGIQEVIYIWHLNTGKLLNTLSKHYQPITCICFTDNGEHFATAGKDGSVLFWNLTQTVAPLRNGDADENEPYYNFNDHGLAVTDLHIGSGGIRSFMYTVSLDRCCKVYDLSNGTLLLSVVYPVALHSVIVDRLETNVFVGTNEGQVLVFNMEKAPRMKEYHLEEDKLQAFVGHTAGFPITCLALSISAQQLISGGDDKQVCIWDVGTKQLIKCISQPGAITNILVNLVDNCIFHPGPKEYMFFADHLNRMITPPEDDEDDCIGLLVTEDYPKEKLISQGDYDFYEFLKSIEGISDMTNEVENEAENETENEDVNEDDMDEISDKDSADKDEEMTDVNAANNPQSLMAELEKLRAENARLKVETQRLVNLNADSKATHSKTATSSKKHKRARQK